MKPSVKSLSEELERVKKEVKEIPALKKKISELQEIIEKLLKTRENNTDQVKSHNCSKCDQTFTSRKSLKKHIADNHASRISCKLCDEAFSKNFELELHIKSDHASPEIFQCEVCDKTFVLKWRLDKHKRNHSDQKRKRCPYFNNNLVCPFSDLGCMFEHAPSVKCMFDNKCSVKLCQYQHSKSESNRSCSKKKTDEEKAEETASLFECQICDFKAECYSDFYDHIEFSHEEDGDDGIENQKQTSG